jgi:hypothetical protein
MFKGLTQDLSGSADICTAVEDPATLAAASYLLPHETILFAFQSPKEEFVFTNEALITVKGENATTTRKLVERHEFRESLISDVTFETTGRIDRDCEIKFRIGESDISIDILRKQEGAVKKYYKALLVLSREQQRRRVNWQFANDGLAKTTAAIKLRGVGLTQQADDVLGWMQVDFERLHSRCYKEAIERALKSTQ